MQKATLLLSDESSTLGTQLRDLLAGYGFRVVESSSRTLTLDFARGSRVDLLILVVSARQRGPTMDLAHQVRAFNKKLPVVLVATESSEELAIDALKAQVSDYFRWPISAEAFLDSLGHLLESAAPPKPETTFGSSRIVGTSRTVAEIKACISRLAAVGSNVLVTGETGTGKQLVAEMIHHDGPRAKQPFVCVNCAAVPDTLVESEFFGYERGAFTGAQSSKQGKLRVADGGTVFFDEIGDMTPYAQAKILRTIESKEIQPLGGKGGIPVDFRVIAATNHNLEKLSFERKFREDLYFRLNVGRIHLPPLRERKEDIPALVQHYIGEFNRLFGRKIEGVSPEMLSALLAYDWPGNIRELRNVLEAAFVDLPAGPVTEVELPEPFRQRMRTPSVSERDHLLSMLLQTNWNKSKTAQKLNWSRMTVYRKLSKYQLSQRPQDKKNVEDDPSANVTSSDAA